MDGSPIHLPKGVKIINEDTDPDHSDFRNANLLPAEFSIDDANDGTDVDDVTSNPFTPHIEIKLSVRSIVWEKCMINKGTGTKHFVIKATRILYGCLVLPFLFEHEYILENPTWNDSNHSFVIIRPNALGKVLGQKVKLIFYCRQDIVPDIDAVYSVAQP
jgi:hypothetical protein